MREIGSEFWDIPICGKENGLFPKNTAWFLSGRSALRAIIQDIKQRNNVAIAAIPSWCCESVIVPFLKEGLKVVFYPSFADSAVQQEICSKADITLAMDYFGYQSDIEFSNGIVIRDITHSFLSNIPGKADYCFGSLRKWCGFYTGGYAFGVRGLHGTQGDYVSLRKMAMQEKMNYIQGKTDSKEYLALFDQAEELLVSCDVVGAAQRDIDAAKVLDVDRIVSRRSENAKVIMNAFDNIAVFKEVNKEMCPIFVPIRVKNRDRLRKYLIDNQIYCPIHWPLTELHRIGEKEKGIYHEELSLVCDQRYDITDMQRIITEVKRGLQLC